MFRLFQNSRFFALFAAAVVLCALFIAQAEIRLYLAGMKIRAANDVPQSLIAPPLAVKEFDKFSTRYVALVKGDGALKAIETLREDADVNASVKRSCHELIHAIGHAAYDAHGGFAGAMRVRDEYCNSGYIHGVLERHIEGASDTLIAVMSACEEYDAATFKGAQCNHGVGHGIMFATDDDLFEALSLCDKLSSTRAQEDCANGVFMENFSADQKSHVSLYVSDNDPFYPCGDVDFSVRDTCHMNAPLYHLFRTGDDYRAVLAACNSAPLLFMSACAVGVGLKASRDSSGGIAAVETICERTFERLVAACLTGAVADLALRYASIARVANACGSLSPQNVPVCRATLEMLRDMYPDLAPS